MTVKFTLKCCRLFIAMLICQQTFAQNSILVNFGSNACSNTVPGFSLIKDPLSAAPTTLTDCDLSAQLPSYFSSFVAYNPADNKIYMANISSGVDTKIWVYDMGLPASIACPVMPASPNYSYSYIANNFEFDNNGNLWAFSNFDATLGQCNIDKFDVNTGTVINTRLVQFPAGNFPTTISSGDFTILPNGRMFAVLGSGICQLYEITNYSGSATATATYLATMPRDCYGIAYLNGLLELTGTDFVGNCYYFDYDIASSTMGTEKVFQNGQMPIDNTSLSPFIGCTKRLVSSTSIDATTADLVYELYVQNMGNMVLNNINISDNLAAAFLGAGNVSNVEVSFVPGSNGAGLTLNPAYNGTTVTNILSPGQSLPNNIEGSVKHFFKLQIKCRAIRLVCGRAYYNSGFATGEVGSGANVIIVSDSTNDGDSTMIDPNMNGNPNNAGENTPTIFAYRVLPVRFINVSASLVNSKTSQVNWQVATPMENAARFEVEFSSNARIWQRLGTLPVTDYNKSNWQFTHAEIPTGALYYRIKQTDKDGMVSYSRVVLLNNKTKMGGYVVYPNPANNFIAISAGGSAGSKKTIIQLYGIAGKLLMSKPLVSSAEEINVAAYPDGSYLLKIAGENESETYKVVVKH